MTHPFTITAWSPDGVHKVKVQGPLLPIQLIGLEEWPQPQAEKKATPRVAQVSDGGEFN
jgi:hypothetical protein